MNAASRDTDTTRTRPANYLIGIAAIIAVAVLFQTVGKPAWHGAVDSDWVRAQGLSSGSDWVFSATLGRMQRSTRPVADAQVHQLYELAVAGRPRALDMLLQAYARNGFPEPLITQISQDLNSADARQWTSLYLITQLARSRNFGPEVETAVLAAGQQPGGGLSASAITALGNLSERRPLADTSIAALMSVAEGKPPAVRSALGALAQAAAAHGLPDWAAERINLITRTSRDPGAMNDGLKILTSLGRMDDALAVLRGLTHSMIDPLLLNVALSDRSAAELQQLIADKNLHGVVRAGALSVLAARDDGRALTTRSLENARVSEDAYLRKAAYEALTRLTRKQSAAPTTDWGAMLTSGLDDPDPGVRIAVKESLRFAPLIPEQKKAFQQQLLTSGTERQKLSVLQLLFSYEANPSASMRQPVQTLASSPNPEIAAMASNVLARWEPASRVKETRDKLLSALLPALASLPVLICLGFGLYFVARLVVYARAGSRRAVAALAVTALWGLLSFGLGALLFIFVLGAGHSGQIGIGTVFTYLVVMGLYAVVGVLLRLPLRR